jgi:soluble lytic murein transglycosylase-like protein
VRAALLLGIAAGAAALALAPRARAAIAPSADVNAPKASGPWTPPSSAAPYLDAIHAAELAYGLPYNLLARVIAKESGFNPEAVSPAGALGIAQFEPDTAAELGVDPFDPESAIDGAARYLAELNGRFGTWPLALAAYNWGQGNLARKGIGAAPPETRAYIAAILADIPGAS